MSVFDDHQVEAKCPKCQYPLEFTIRDIRLESVVNCPNCKNPIQLKDSEGSAQAAHEQVKETMNNLKKTRTAEPA